MPESDRPTLATAVAAQLHAALVARWQEPEACDALLESALAAAAKDAKARGLRPEELLLALKKSEQDVANTLDVVDTQDRDRFRMWLVGACMRAFFATDQRSDR